MFVIQQKGNFDNTEKFLKNVGKANYLSILDKYGRQGVAALSSATPMDSGLTASSWSYEIHTSGKNYTINWTNSNIVDGVPIAILIQYGHGTSNGGYVQGRDYINPALRHIFDQMADEVWKEVTRL